MNDLTACPSELPQAQMDQLGHTWTAGGNAPCPLPGYGPVLESRLETPRDVFFKNLGSVLKVKSLDSSHLKISKSRLGSARLQEASLEISTKIFKLRARVGRRVFQAVCQRLFSNGLNLYPRKKPRRKHHLLDWFTFSI
jgi:hypothetical protein